MKIVRFGFILLGLMPPFTIFAGPAAKLPACRTGDIIFQTSQSSQSEAIQKATRSPYSHCGLVVVREGTPFVFEAGQPVAYASLSSWIDRGKGRMFKIKRLKKPDALEAAIQDGRFDRACKQYEGKNYDTTFMWSDDRIYCSELVWKVYRDAFGIELCRPKRIGDMNLKPPLVKAWLRERYVDKVPVDEPTVSPADLYISKHLISLRDF